MTKKQFLNWASQDSGSTKFFTWFHYGLAAIYLIALFPLFFQINTLIGSNGLLPAKNLVVLSIEQNGLANTFLRFPSFFLFYQSDTSLYFIIALGCFGAMLMFISSTRFIGALMAWMSFLSITTIGGDFLIIIIDLFLAEVGFLALFSTYFLRYNYYIPNIIDFAFRLLNFRLWFCMGINKFYMPLDVWTNFTFFNSFFQAQPMPTPMAKIFHQTPLFLQYIAEIGLFIGEVIIPLFVFGKKIYRIIGFITFFFISFLIQLNGNYGYFNVLSIIVALTILKDSDIKFLTSSKSNIKQSIFFLSKSNFIVIALSLHILLQIAYCIYVFNPNPYSMQNQFNYFLTNKEVKNPILNSLAEPIRWIGFWRICNPYGVFKGIPQYHGELRFSGSMDSIIWKTYQFKYLPSAQTDYLGFYAPYYPRLDHLIFYETLSEGTYKHNPLDNITPKLKPWPCNFVHKLLINDSNITKALENNPFANEPPPNFIKVEAYRLSFSNKNNKNWDNIGPLYTRVFKKNNFDCNGSIFTYQESMHVVF